MKQLGRSLLASAGLVLVAMVLFAVSSTPLSAAGPTPVVVVNVPLPVVGAVTAHISNASIPVTGTVTVSSLPPVSGTVNANITNASVPVTGTVAVNSLPPVAAIGAQCDAPFDGTGFSQCLLATVPSGQTLLIETITCAASVAAGSPVVPIVLNMGGPPIGGGAPISLNHRLLLTRAATIGSLDYYGLTTPVHMYAAGGSGGSTNVYVFAGVGPGTANTGDLTCAISGQMLTQ